MKLTKHVIMTQKMARKYIASKRVNLLREVHMLMVVKRIQKWFKNRMKFRRKLRGQNIKYKIHAIRLQAFIRGYLKRLLVYKMKSSKMIIVYKYRKYFKKKYLHFIINIQRLYRNYKLIQAIKCIQGNTRMFLVRRKYIK